MLCCGSKSFPKDDGDDHHRLLRRPKSTRSLPAAKTTARRRNPYSTIGLDKFAAVVAKVESLKQTIIAESGPLDASSIRFTFTDSHWVPIFLHGDRRNHHDKRAQKKRHPAADEILICKSPSPTSTSPQADEKACPKANPGGCRRRRRRRTRAGRSCTSWYWLPALVVILACLAFSGTALATCCTGGWWFLAGKLWGGGGRCGCEVIKKGSYVYMRRASENIYALDRIGRIDSA